MTTQDSALRYEPASDDGIGVLWFDCPGKKVNTLSVDLIDKVRRVLDAAKAPGPEQLAALLQVRLTDL